MVLAMRVRTLPKTGVVALRGCEHEWLTVRAVWLVARVCALHTNKLDCILHDLAVR